MVYAPLLSVLLIVLSSLCSCAIPLPHTQRSQAPSSSSDLRGHHENDLVIRRSITGTNLNFIRDDHLWAREAGTDQLMDRRDAQLSSHDLPEEHTLVRRSKVGDWFKKVGRKIKSGFQKFGHVMKVGFQKVGGWLKNNWQTVLGVATKLIP